MENFGIENTEQEGHSTENEHPVENLNELKHVIKNVEREARGEEVKKEAENAVPPKAWENQQKAYDDAWENNKNQLNED
ncbi:hypothetical protein [Kaistella palustris]|uniref:hypothetical protein n=1 Tax=Kaistella palustris TaxID=493376 RepID=UPI0004290A67|nr:hypothetical protein [Kaistella palustris]